jgi:hypothetical protein
MFLIVNRRDKNGCGARLLKFKDSAAVVAGRAVLRNATRSRHSPASKTTQPERFRVQLRPKSEVLGKILGVGSQ